jgi:hypothetical protein
MNINRIHTVVGKNSLTNVDLSLISSMTFFERKISKGFLGLSKEKQYGISIVFKTYDLWVNLDDHKTAQQEYASLFTAWTEYLEWHS